MDDIKAYHSRQFAPEYSQACYIEMVTNSNGAIGNYLTQYDKFSIKSWDRDTMILTIQDLHSKKPAYKLETLHLAGNIADRYLAHLALGGGFVPNLTILSVTCLLIAAKIE